MSTRDAVRRLAVERPDWLPVLASALAVAARVEEHGGEFAGAWVVDELARRGTSRWIPNLRILASYGLIEKSGDSTRGGRRAYYRMPERRAVADALREWTAMRARPRPQLRFVGVGASKQPPFDTARRSGDTRYEPRSWR